MSSRRLRRAVALALALTGCVLHSWLMRLERPWTLERRALWLKDASRRVLKALGLGIALDGQPPTCGLVVANHLGYLDILFFSAAMPCFFVAKKEIDSWPYFGWAARTAGTIFLDRRSMRSAKTVAAEIAQRLRRPVAVLLFPEGTSTDGTQILCFHSRLIDPATKASVPVTAAAIRYMVGGGLEERDLCFYGNAAFLPHLWKVLGVSDFSAQLKFGEPRIYANRRAAATRIQAEVTAMRDAGALAVS